MVLIGGIPSQYQSLMLHFNVGFIPIKIKEIRAKIKVNCDVVLRSQLIGCQVSECFFEEKVQSKVTWPGTAYRWELPDNRSLQDLDVEWTLQVEQSASSRIPNQDKKKTKTNQTPQAVSAVSNVDPDTSRWVWCGHQPLLWLTDLFARSFVPQAYGFAFRGARGWFVGIGLGNLRGWEAHMQRAVTSLS